MTVQVLCEGKGNILRVLFSRYEFFVSGNSGQGFSELGDSSY